MEHHDHDPLVIAGREFRSRLITGTGKYDSFETMRDAVAASGCELVTVAVRRIDFDAPGEDITALPSGGSPPAPEHVGSGDGRRGRARGPPGPRGGPAGLDQAGGHSGRSLPAPRSRGDAPRGGGARGGRVHRAAVRPARPGAPEEARGGRLRHRDAARRPDRERARAQARATRSASWSSRRKCRSSSTRGCARPADAAEALELGADAVLVNTAIARAGDPVAMAQGFPPRGRGGAAGLPRRDHGGEREAGPRARSQER